MKKPVTIILGAVPWEIRPIIAALSGRRTGKLHGFPWHAGRIGGLEVITAITGIGKTNAAMITSLFLAEFKPVRLLFTGTAARLNPDLRTGDVIVGLRTFHHDAGSWQDGGMVYRKIIGPVAGVPTNYQFKADPGLVRAALSAAKNYDPRPVTANGETYTPVVRAGRICAGDIFGMPQSKIDDIRAKLACDLVEMEGAAVGQVCTELGVPHLVIRGGSNRAQPDPGGDYKRLGQIAARQAAFFTLHLVHHLA